MMLPCLSQRERSIRQRIRHGSAAIALCSALLAVLAACDATSTPSPQVAATATPSESATASITPSPTATLAPTPTSTPVSHSLFVVFNVNIDVVDCPTAQPVGTLCINVTGSGTSSTLGAMTVSRSAVLSPPGDDSCGPSTTTGKLTMADGSSATFKASGTFCRSNSTAQYTYTITGGTGRYTHATGTGKVEVPRLTDTPSPKETWNGTLFPGA